MKTEIISTDGGPDPQRGQAQPIQTNKSCNGPPVLLAAERQTKPVAARHGLLWFGWLVTLSALALLLTAALAMRMAAPGHRHADASYGSCLAALDAKLSRALAAELRNQGLEFDAALVSVEAPACERAVCLLKGVVRESKYLLVGGVTARHAGCGRWSFVGRGGLEELAFQVDALPEMRRLAASTPPDFPAVYVYRPAVTPMGANASEPAVELVLPVSLQGEQPHWLDLETGRCITEPDAEYFINSPVTSWLSQWLAAQHVDLCALALENSRNCLVTRCLKLVPVRGEAWTMLPSRQITTYPALDGDTPQGRQIAWPDRDRTDTYLFRTGQGTRGIIRLMEFESSQPQLLIRYKLATAEADAVIEAPLRQPSDYE